MAAGTEGLLIMSAVIIGLGIAAKVIGDRYRVPSVVFLLFFGIFLGPNGLKLLVKRSFENPPVSPDLFVLIDPQLFGRDAVSTIVSIAVAIIVFEGGFHLKIEKIQKASKSTLKVVTLGAAITFFGTGALIHYILEEPWSMSLLTSSLVVATGPTVITPLLSQVDVREEVGGLLESEGIINDVSAAILAIVMFEFVVESFGTEVFFRKFVTTLGTGVLIGIVTAGVTWSLLQHIRDSSQNVRLIVLSAAVLSFAVSNTVATESGVAAVATAGIIMGNIEIPYKEDVEEFKGDITFIVLSIVFLLLAAQVRIDAIVGLGVGGILVVVLLMLFVRPLAILASTTDSALTLRERIFVSNVGPRGIIPASIATLFSLRLEEEGVANPEIVVSVVFLVILTTVVLQAGTAPFIADKLDIIPMNIIVVGGGRIGRDLADRLSQRGENVVIIEKDEEKIERLRDKGYSVVEGNGTESEILEEAGINRTRIFVAATGDDDQNILACQTARTKFNIDNVISRVNNIENLESFEDLGVKTISPARATSLAIDNLIERPALYSWMSELGKSGDVVEVDVNSKDIIGKTVDEIDLPEGCIIALIRRDDEQFVPKPSVEIMEKDHVTILGRTEAVREATKLLTKK